MSKNPENRWKLMKKANIDRVILHNFWTTWGISIKFSGKKIKSHKIPGFHPLSKT